MGIFNLWRAKGDPVGADTIIKRMSANAGDFKGVTLDAEDHPVNVFECGKIDVTGERDRDMLYPCRETVPVIRNRIKKNQLVAFYLSAQEHELKFHWKNGGSTEMTARLDRAATSSLSSWLLLRFRNDGESVTAEALSRMLDDEFTSDDPPDWLMVSRRVDIPEPEKTVKTDGSTVADLKVDGTVFGYHIEKQLGSGGQGQVFLATDPQAAGNTRQVVLKVLHENCKDEASRQEFIKEANTLADFRDDRIAACYWCRRLGDVPILAMEYIDGESLDSYLARLPDGKISEAETRELLRPIAEALDQAHMRQIFHRDVKPQNIIVRKNPKQIGPQTIKTCLLDFGIAWNEQAGDSRTMAQSIRGTKQYMSPGQKLGKPASADMDVYSLAVTAYECLTGTMPYPDGWLPDVKVPPLPSDSPFAKAVMRGLAMMPKDRPATCCELIDPPPTQPIPPIPDEGTDSEEKKKKKTEEIRPAPNPDDLNKLERSFCVCRQMLACSATKIEKENPERAEWLRGAQVRLRDLTHDLSRADASALVRFFEELGVQLERERMKPDDFFSATDRLVELRNGLPRGDGKVLQALRASIS